MDPAIIYGIIVASLLFLFCLRGISDLVAIIHSRQVTTFMSTRLYPYLYRRRRFLPPISGLVAALQFLYWAVTIVFNIIGASTLSEAGSRAGSIAIFNFVPLVMAERLGFMADVMDMPLRNLLHVHKSIGVMTILQTAAHVTLKCVSGEFGIRGSESDRNFNGLMAGGAMALLALLALPFPRKYLYEIFLKSHYALSCLAAYSLWRHTGGNEVLNRDRVFLLISVGLLVCLNLLRFISILYRNTFENRPWTTAKVKQFNGAAEVVITVPRRWKVRPGQWVLLLTPAVGFWSFCQRHPYSIAWWSEDKSGDAETVSLLVKAQHGLSRDLAATSPGESFIVALEGPYGQSVDTSRYGTLVLFATGIGIAAQLSVLKRAFRDYQLRTNILRRISIIWQMDSEGYQDWAKPWIDQCVDADKEKILRISLYVVDDFLDPEKKLSNEVAYGSGVRINKLYGKANVEEVMDFEMEKRVGRMLVTVSAQNHFRDRVRSVAQRLMNQQVDYHEFDFQPEISKGFWSRKKPQVDYEGVIRGKES